MTGRKWPIRYQLAAIVVVPLVALAVAAARQTYVALDRAAEANQIQREATFTVSIDTLAHELQRERGLSGGYVGSGYQTGLNEVTAQRARADDAVRAFDEQADEVGRDNARPLVRAALETTQTALSGLSAQRQAIDGQQLDVGNTLGFYTDAIIKLLSVQRAMADASSDPGSSRISTALLNLSEVKEFTGLERGFMNSVFSADQFGVGEYSRMLSIVAQQDAWFELFRTTADSDTMQFYERHVAGEAVDRAAELRALGLAEGAESQPLSVDPVEWWSTMTTKIDLMRDVELRLSEQLRAHAATVAGDAEGAAARDVAVAVLVVLLSVTLSVVTARRMARSLRGLHDAALEAADVRLPAVVARLADGKDVDVDQETEPVQIRSNDEIGDTAKAFNHIHDVAVRLTVEQAGMRRSLGDTLLNLARRSQTLIHQQLELIDELEQSERDSTVLESLFRLDHLATRMRRHTEDLIVLSGAAPSRGWTAPVPLRDVVRGAIAEVENYARVKAVNLPDVDVVGHAVGDLLHLLAELIENATKFSPPYAPVQVTAGEVGNGYVIEVEDRGIGMPAADLTRRNERLLDPPAFDLSTSDRLGLYVVGRLAARHSIRVCLRDSVFDGVTAVVLVGRGLLRPAERADDSIPATATTVTQPTPTRAATPGPYASVPAQPRPVALPPRSHGTPHDAHARQAQHPEPPPSPLRPSSTPRSPTPDRPRGPSPAGPSLPGRQDPTGSAGMTALGLPRRVPRKNLADALRRDEPTAATSPHRHAPLDRRTPTPEPAPTPEQIRAMLAGYQSGFDRGLVASAPEAGRPEPSDDENPIADRILDYPNNTAHRNGRGTS